MDEGLVFAWFIAVALCVSAAIKKAKKSAFTDYKIRSLQGKAAAQVFGVLGAIVFGVGLLMYSGLLARTEYIVGVSALTYAAFSQYSPVNGALSFLTVAYKTEFAIDAGFKLGLITDRLAGKEMYIGRHYEKSQKWAAAINRFKNVVENYETSVYVEEAIYRLAEIHYIIGLTDEAKKYATLLGYNYGSSNWYKASYKIFNKDYNLSEKEIFSIKEKDKKSIFKKFKKRFKNLFN